MGLNTSQFLNVALVVVGAVVTLSIIAALLPTFFGSIQDINENVSTETTGDTVGDSILALMPILIAVSAVFAIVGLIFAGLRFRKG